MPIRGTGEIRGQGHRGIGCDGINGDAVVTTSQQFCRSSGGISS